jgi:hypothetical protein
MDKATTKRLGEGLRKEYRAPEEQPEGMTKLLEALRRQGAQDESKASKPCSEYDQS